MNNDKNKYGGLKVEMVYTSDAIKDLLKDLEYKEKRFVELAERNKRLSDKLTKVKKIIKRFLEFANYDIDYDPAHPQEYTDLWNELCEQAEQFLKDSEKDKIVIGTEKESNKND